MLSGKRGVTCMELQYQLMAREKGLDVFDKPRGLEAADMKAAKVEARRIFATARRMAKVGGQAEPKLVRILEHEVEMWRWNWTQENDAPRGKGL